MHGSNVARVREYVIRGNSRALGRRRHARSQSISRVFIKVAEEYSDSNNWDSEKYTELKEG